VNVVSDGSVYICVRYWNVFSDVLCQILEEVTRSDMCFDCN